MEENGPLNQTFTVRLLCDLNLKPGDKLPKFVKQLKNLLGHKAGILTNIREN